MAREGKSVVDTLKKIGTVRRRVRESRTARTPIRVLDAYEYDILQQALELLSDTINTQHLLHGGTE